MWLCLEKYSSPGVQWWFPGGLGTVCTSRGLGDTGENSTPTAPSKSPALTTFPCDIPCHFSHMKTLENFSSIFQNLRSGWKFYLKVLDLWKFTFAFCTIRGRPYSAHASKVGGSTKSVLMRAGWGGWVIGALSAHAKSLQKALICSDDHPFPIFLKNSDLQFVGLSLQTYSTILCLVLSLKYLIILISVSLKLGTYLCSRRKRDGNHRYYLVTTLLYQISWIGGVRAGVNKGRKLRAHYMDGPLHATIIFPQILSSI